MQNSNHNYTCKQQLVQTIHTPIFSLLTCEGEVNGWQVNEGISEEWEWSLNYVRYLLQTVDEISQRVWVLCFRF
jgi:hypothetical protein